MRKISRKAKKGRFETVKVGFVRGWTDMLDMTGSPRVHRIPGANRTSEAAFRQDWEKLGGDMRRAAERVTGGAE